jgi:hypothetical protein
MLGSNTPALNGFFLGVGVAFLHALREGVADAQLGDELGGVLGGVDCEGFGDDEEGLGEFADGELLAGALETGQVSVTDTPREASDSCV